MSHGLNQCPVLCPLNRVRAGQAVRIRKLCATPAISDRLREIGFSEDRVIRLLSASANVVCQVCNARLGIAAGLAAQILVEPLPALPG